jgi:hypothetical protein
MKKKDFELFIRDIIRDELTLFKTALLRELGGKVTPSNTLNESTNRTDPPRVGPKIDIDFVKQMMQGNKPVNTDNLVLNQPLPPSENGDLPNIVIGEDTINKLLGFNGV